MVKRPIVTEMKKAFLACLLLLIAACRREAPVAPVATPKPAPPAVAMEPYKAQLLDGSPFDLASERGHVVFLNVWATWCLPCRAEIPELNKLHEKYAARGFKVVGVSVDEGNPDGVKQFVNEQKITYPIVLDPDGKLATLLNTSVIPTSIVVDKKGDVVWKHYGVVKTTDDTLVKALESALAR
jgi:cytochrome c biogenesis protein CcmG/thiol:disulfide interchange protein DsbE